MYILIFVGYDTSDQHKQVEQVRKIRSKEVASLKAMKKPTSRRSYIGSGKRNVIEVSSSLSDPRER